MIRETGRAIHGLLWLVVIISCALAFIQAADHNYRSTDGHLGVTVPPYQIEIVSGTAPAPYVYRQAVPQLRQWMAHLLRPGHAALLLDFFFAIVAVVASLVTARTLLRPDLILLGPPIATLACISAYPNDKPEAVAAIAAICLLSALVVTRRHTAAIIVAILAAPIRPEIPILFGLAMMLGKSVANNGRLVLRGPHLVYSLSTIAGLCYLLIARYLLWPDAQYPVGVSPMMLMRNLILPLAWPALIFALCLLGFSVAQVMICHFHVRSNTNSDWFQFLRPMMGLQLFCIFYVVFILVFAQVEEIRVFQPLLVPTILGGVWIRTQVNA